MRTATIAALVLALAACGGDGGLSLTEPGQITRCAAAADGFDYAGTWAIDEWGCYIGADDGGANNCTPENLPWTSDDAVSISMAGAGHTVTIGADSMTDANSLLAIEGTMTNGAFTMVMGCDDGSLWIQTEVGIDSFGDIFAAYAHR